MRKKWIGILGTAIVLSILLCGCGIIGALSSDNAGGGEFDGAHMKATYDPANWTARTQEIGEGNTAVELLYWDGSVGQMSMAACDMTNEEVEHLYEDLLWQDELLGDIQEEEQQNDLSADDGTACYSYVAKTDYTLTYYKILQAKRVSADQIIVGIATVYIMEEEDELAEACRNEIIEIFAGVTYSNTAAAEGIAASKEEPTADTTALAEGISGVAEEHLAERDARGNEFKILTELAEGCEAVYQTEVFAPMTGTFCKVYMPMEDPEENDGRDEQLFYNAHGLDVYLKSYGDFQHESHEEKTLEDIFDEQAEHALDSWEEVNSVSHIEKGDIVKSEDGTTYFQYCSGEREDFEGNVCPQHLILYAVEDQGFKYFLRIKVDTVDSDAETATILEEMGRCYQFDLSMCMP